MDNGTTLLLQFENHSMKITAAEIGFEHIGASSFAAAPLLGYWPFYMVMVFLNIDTSYTN